MEQKNTHNIDGIPYEATGWNWGAFLLGPIWGIGNRVWISLLTLIPLVGFVMAFVLGAKGGTWAWKQKPWKDIKHFKRAQLNWAIAGAGVWGVIIILLAAAPSQVPINVSSDGNNTSSSSSTTSGTPTFKMGETVRTGDMEYTVTNARITNKATHKYRDTAYPESGQFIVVDLTMKNVGQEEVHISNDMIKLVDTAGAEYSMSDRLSSSGDKGFFIYEEMNPNATKKAKLTFDVTQNPLEDFSIHAQPKRFSTIEDPAIIQLIK